MEYPIGKSICLTKIPLGQNGCIEPLCNKCKTKDCTNRIEYKTVSLFGINYKFRLLIKYSEPVMVLECEGFSMD